MDEPQIYISIANRYLKGGAAAIIPAHELNGFACYHAFESAGGAYVTHFRGHYPHGHPAKLSAFVTRCRGEKFGRGASVLAIKLRALRNAFLYPTYDGVDWIHPNSVFTPDQVSDLHRRVGGIVRAVDAIVSKSSTKKI